MQTKQEQEQKRLQEEKEKLSLAMFKPADKFLLGKFNKEFDNAAKELDLSTEADNTADKMLQLEEQQQFSPQPERHNADLKAEFEDGKTLRKLLTFEQLRHLLSLLGYATEFKLKAASAESALAHDLWAVLDGKVLNSVRLEDVRVVAQVVSRLIDPKRVLNDGFRAADKSKALDTSSSLGWKNEAEDLCIGYSEVPKIQHHFKVFYLNQLQFQGTKLEKKKEEQVKQESTKNQFKPRISQNTQALAL